MDREQLKSTFDRQAPTYDQQWSKLSAFRDGIHVLLGSIFGTLPDNARVLCVGAGTGAEILHLAELFPRWTFMAVDPSSGMQAECRRRVAERGFSARCEFHEGFVESLPDSASFDAATCLLVSQFFLDAQARSAFFRGIARRLKPGAILASSDLASDLKSPSSQDLLEVWLRTMAVAELSSERIQQMREAYQRDVAVLPPREVETIIMSGGFDQPVQFFQAGLIHAWYTRRPA